MTCKNCGVKVGTLVKYGLCVDCFINANAESFISEYFQEKYKGASP